MSLQDWLLPMRWVHLLSASAWFGEVLVINFVLIPALSGRVGQARREFLATVFPKVFRLASVLSATTALTGAALLCLYTRGNWRMLTEGRFGHFILVGGALGLVLTLFHFFMENKLARRVGIGRPDTPDQALADVHVKLKVVPRIGLAVITTIYFLMMVAARGT